MKKIFRIKLGGLQKKTINLVLIVLFLTVAAFFAVSSYQNKMLLEIVGETRIEQQQAISQTSEETMHQVIMNTLVSTTALRANIADNDFAEVVNNTYMLQTMAQGLIGNRDNLTPAEFSLPDPSMNGRPSAMVLCEEGVDYQSSEYLGIVAHMREPMIAMLSNSDKIDGCYIGLADGTDFCVDDKALSKLDENGNLIPFPVRERPWYRGAVETGGLFFTGIVKDAFTGKPGITCSAPVIVNGETVGVVGIDILLDNMNDFINSSSNDNGFVFIVNSNGQVIISPENNSLFTVGTADLRETDNTELADFVRKALDEATELTTLNIGNKEYYAAGAPMPASGWAVISIVDKETTEQPEKLMLTEYDRINNEASAKFNQKTEKTKLSGRLIFAAIFIISVCAALAASNRIVKPIKTMTESIIECGETGQSFKMKDDYRTNDEIEVLAESFDDLSKKTKQYIEDITEITREKERVSTELYMAEQIQRSMLPHIFPAFPNRHEFDIYATMDPAKEVGGDFYDFFLIDDDHLCMVMADVSGKGIPAALFMMISKVILQSCAMLGKSAAEILNKTNEALCSSNQVEMFVTVWLGILEISTGKIIASNAGHEYPALEKGGHYKLLKDKHGFVVGGLEGTRYQEYEIQMKPGDRLFLYTDGIPEASDSGNRMFGSERLLAVLNREPGASPERILRNVQNEVAQFVGGAEQFDDMTMLCFEYKGQHPDKSLTQSSQTQD